MDSHYDIAIIGLGCAGSHVLLELLSRTETRDLNIVVLDDFSRESMHKTWSYWERGAGKWDTLVSNTWQYAYFKNTDVDKKIDLKGYTYKSINSPDFINHALEKATAFENVRFIKEPVLNCTAHDTFVTINYALGSCTASLVLDSRIDPDFFKEEDSITLDQHFKGWVIQSEQPVFETNAIVMMDYRLRDPGTTSFMYVLPHNAHTALVEFTYFSKKQVADSVYDDYMNQYIKDYLNIDSFKILHTEQGSIPMTAHDFAIYNKPHIHKIGTAGGWVKPSTGYSFKSSEIKAAQLVSNYIAGRNLNQNLFSKKFRFYDAIMLDVLAEDNERGAAVFQNLYTKQPIENIFAFLDEETSFKQEIAIMLPLTSWPFIKFFFKRFPQLLKK
jgi:lycopene beta-cyclase